MLFINQSMVLGAFGSAVLGWLMFFLSVFLILLILVQRGKGGGLAGALGGPGGQSAFGSKAGDTFTVITAVSAIVWGLVCAIAMYTMGVPPTTADDVSFEIDEEPPALTSPADETAGAGGLSGLSGLLSDDGDSAESDATLTPADGDGEESEGSDAAEGGDASEGAGESEDSGTPAADLGSTETDAESDTDEGSE